MIVLKTGLSLACLLLSASAAMAQMPCATHDDIAKLLGSKYLEGVTHMGLAGGKNLIEIYVSEKGTFTVVATQPSGLSCIIAAGKDWEQMADPPKNLTSL